MTTNIISSALVLEDLRNENYYRWRKFIRNYLVAQDLWVTISDEPNTNNPDWRRKNAAAFHAIQISCGTDILKQIWDLDSAKKAWDRLEKLHNSPPTIVEFQVISAAYKFVKKMTMAGNANREFLQYQSLYKDVRKGDLVAVKEFLRVNKAAINAKISEIGQTALHVATFAGHVKIVKELVMLMSKEDLQILDAFNETALSIAASNGSIKIAKCLHENNMDLVLMRNMSDHIPLITASSTAHKDVTKYLYSITPPESLDPSQGTNGGMFLYNIISGQMFDLALDLLSPRKCPSLATAINNSGFIGLNALSCMPHVFHSGITKLQFWRRCIYYCIPMHSPAYFGNDDQRGQSGQKNIILQVLGQLRGLVSTLLKLLGIKQIYDMKLIHLQAFQLLSRLCEDIHEFDMAKLMGKGKIVNAIVKAVDNGIVEFIEEIIKAKPEILLITNHTERNLLRFAIECRQEKIFSLIYKFGSIKNSLYNPEDDMLKVASELPEFCHLARTPGAALQMQRELLWFKEVERITPHFWQKKLNEADETPRQMFTRNHKELVKEGEKWMKDTATSCTVVGALIITIMFAIALTVPGGTDQTSGSPILLHKKLFKVFVISDAISLFSSSTSVLMFLGILTSRYAEGDFLESLPKRLIFGLSTLFISIAAMMVAFSAALLIMLKGRLDIAIPIISLAGFPIIGFILLQFPLLLEIFITTFLGIFDMKLKR